MQRMVLFAQRSGLTLRLTYSPHCLRADKLEIEAIRHRTARRLWPEARPAIVGATAEQQIEALAMRKEPLDQALFRRDQIWFTEKDREGATHIYPLLEFSPRREEALAKGYLQGRYGAIPFIEGLGDWLGANAEIETSEHIS